MKTKKFLMIGILMALGIFAYGNFAFAIVPIMDFDLGLVPSYLTGEGAGYQNSWSVSNAGDVNGDGYDDFLIGVPLNNNANGWRAGKTYLFLGKGGGWFGWQMGINLPGGGASFIGETGGDWSGYSVSGAGDVNGDGYDDFLIGARFSDDNGNESGKTYLFLGDDPIPWGMNTDISNANASFVGIADSHSGYRVSNVGNVNGDPYDDFLISAVHNWGGVYNSGKTYLFLGNNPIPWGAGTNLSNADASFIGEGAGDISGCSLSSAGDVNNDGNDDFLIGAYRNVDGGSWMDPMTLELYEAGKTYLFLGKAAADWGMDFNLSNSDASFIGETADEWSGYSVSGIGDVDNDNFDDFIIGAPRYDEIGVGDVGKTYLILGKPTAGWTTNVDLSNSDASFIGEIPVWGDESGYSVSGVGDVNNDNHDDFIIGARGNGQGGFDLGHGAGQTYLILGKPTVSWTNNVNLVNADASFIGDNPGDECGWRVSGAGDVNKDGTDDFLISASLNDGGGVRSGRTYLILTEAPVTVTIEAEDSNGDFIADGPDGISGTADDDTVYAANTNPITILSSASTSGASILLIHKVEFQIGAGLWTPLFSCWDVGGDGYCDADPTVKISDLKLDDGSDIPQLQIGPFAAGTVINYRSSAIDTALNTGSSSTKSFSVVAAPNTAPTVNAGVANQPGDYCGFSPRATLNWVFDDADGDGQGAFQVQVDDDAGFGSPIIDTGKVAPSSANSYNTSLSIVLAYNTTYYWRVKVWDDQVPDAGSVYSTGTSFLTPVHRYPDVDFSCSLDEGATWSDCASISPDSWDDIDFDANQASGYTACGCDGGGSQIYVGSPGYHWDFGDGNVDNGAATTDNSYGEGSYQVTLNVIDGDENDCECVQTITVGKGMPKWKEVVPR